MSIRVNRVSLVFQRALKNAGITPQMRPAATPATGQSAYRAQEGRFFP